MSARAVTIGSLLTLLAACSKHPLAAHWDQEVAPGAVGLELWFDDKAAVGGCNHQPGDADDDIEGNYTLADNRVTITASWKNSKRQFAMSGSLAGDRLELVGADGRLTFRRKSQ